MKANTSTMLPIFRRMVIPTVFVLAFVTSTPYIYAQDGVGLRLQPSTLDERADPGTSLDGELTITNQDGGAQTYYLSTRNIDNMDDSGRPVFSTDAMKDAERAAEWITLSVPSIDIEQGQSRTVSYRVDVPQDASPGSYFAAFFVSRQADKAVDNSAGVGFEVASLLHLRVNGIALESVNFREFATDKLFYTQPNVTFSTRLENTGTVHERPRGLIAITNLFGEKVDQVLFNENAGGIMPRADRVFETSWATDSLLLGRYTALASIVYGDTEKKTITREVTFWVIPLREVAMVLGALVILAFIITVGMRRYVRKALARAGHTQTQVQAVSMQVSFMKRLTRTLAWLLILLAAMFIAVLVFFA